MNFKLIRSQHGFFSVQSIFFVGLFGILIFCFGFLTFAAHAKMQFRSTCLKESIQIQRQIIQFEKKLFALNPLSTALQVEYDITIAQATVAELAIPIALALFAKAELIQAKQVQLEIVQQGLIKAAEIMIILKTAQVEMQMINDSSTFGRAWSLFLKSSFKIQPSQVAKVSVRAVTSGIAPNYELEDNYQQDQKVAFVWQLKYSTKPQSQKLIESKNIFELQCEARPLEKGTLWSIEI